MDATRSTDWANFKLDDMGGGVYTQLNPTEPKLVDPSYYEPCCASSSCETPPAPLHPLPSIPSSTKTPQRTMLAFGS